MFNVSDLVSRRTFLATAVVLPCLTSALTARADADASKASQSAMHYQSTPNGNMHCSLCTFYVPNADATSSGTCKVVDGSISPQGYCIAYSAK